ncbi:hypothetical protein PI125_g22783 [Phytophthora idaei]|nr:hypothetical protein PI125_g22783 [Phytophthora idaei]
MQRLLVQRVRPHSANGNTCHQVWHLDWDHGRNRPRFGHDIQMRATAAKQRHKRRRPTAGQDDEGTDAATADDKSGADRGEDGDESHGVVTAAV